MRFYIGLIHYPVYNKNYQKIASAITNFDLHDLSRLARTYGAKRFFVVTPLDDQRKLAERILLHWTNGYGARYNRYRKEAIEVIKVLASLDDAVKEIRDLEGEDPLLIATDASRQPERAITYSDTTELIISGKVVFILFGTAWGLHEDVISRVNFILDPIDGQDDYNHLSVRTAAGIILDRLTGRFN